MELLGWELRLHWADQQPQFRRNDAGRLGVCYPQDCWPRLSAQAWSQFDP